MAGCTGEHFTHNVLASGSCAMNIAFGPVWPLAPATSREFLVSGFSFLVLPHRSTLSEALGAISWLRYAVPGSRGPLETRNQKLETLRNAKGAEHGTRPTSTTMPWQGGTPMVNVAAEVQTIDHPLVEDSLIRLRNRDTDTDTFRRHARLLTLVLALHVLGDFL